MYKKRVVIKIGSSSLINEDNGFRYETIVELAKQIRLLKDQGVSVTLVTSGAIAAGLTKLGLKKKPTNISLKQACAALGQSSLMKIYEDIFQLFHLKCAQILVNHDDFEDRGRISHLSNTLESLFNNGIVPIVNENDALAIDEIKVGDNDTLSAMLVPMVNAQLLVIISDVLGLYTGNPTLESSKLIPYVEEINKTTWDLVLDEKSKLGTGGMQTKLKAAIIATDYGSDMLIMGNGNMEQLHLIFTEKVEGTLFKGRKKLSGKNHWLLYKTSAKGWVKVDDGAKEALLNHKSLLPKGIVEMSGLFTKGACISIFDMNSNLLAKGITNYSSDVINLVKGKTSGEIDLPIYKKNEIVHVDNLVIIKGEKYEHFNG